MSAQPTLCLYPPKLITTVCVTWPRLLLTSRPFLLWRKVSAEPPDHLPLCFRSHPNVTSSRRLSFSSNPNYFLPFSSVPLQFACLFFRCWWLWLILKFLSPSSVSVASQAPSPSDKASFPLQCQDSAMRLSPSQWEMDGHNGALLRLPVKGRELQSPFPICWECHPEGVSLGQRWKFHVC